MYAIYIPPASKPNLSVLSIKHKTIVIEDMKAQSMRWGYSDVNASRTEIEDLLNSSSLELIYYTSDKPTYLHYNENCTADLLCISPDISIDSKRKAIEDPGSEY
ncbi:hypothetical protein CDAR_605951 [Caerostris darwini]|uniref:Endonuclease/exonuclease/phosphatase domain-containing protein n=1 Tax=Caerostris darwini TaxID=1538125 RepID=A0AAV4QJH9_9ARAC|nr:hypothetical protein CDAR_605951 [Caerostris darwini]